MIQGRKHIDALDMLNFSSEKLTNNFTLEEPTITKNLFSRRYERILQFFVHIMRWKRELPGVHCTRKIKGQGTTRNDESKQDHDGWRRHIKHRAK